MADKDVEVTEVTAEPTAATNGTAPALDGPSDRAAFEHSDLAQSDLGNSEVVQHEVVQPAAQPPDGQAEAGHPTGEAAEGSEAVRSNAGKSEVVQHEVVQTGDGQAEASAGPAQAGAGPAEAGAGPAQAGAGPATEKEPTEEEPGEAAPGETESADPARGGRRTWRAAAALGAATVVLAGFGVWATLHASSLRSNAAAQSNSALTDGPATATVRREVSAAVNTIFSYNYADTAATRRAAQAVLTGPAVRQYNTLFALVTKDAPAQKLVVATRVTNSGVELLNGDRARVLIFADQQDTRSGTSQTSYAGTMFAVTALRQGGRWKIENIDTFGG